MSRTGLLYKLKYDYETSPKEQDLVPSNFPVYLSDTDIDPLNPPKPLDLLMQYPLTRTKR
jgi:hypothetical protein